MLAAPTVSSGTVRAIAAGESREADLHSYSAALRVSHVDFVGNVLCRGRPDEDTDIET
jgi:hypothetical protein